MSDAVANEIAAGAEARIWRLLLGVVIAVCGGILPTFLVGGLAVQLRQDLGFDEAELGVAIAASFVVAAASSAAIGRWVQSRSAASVLRGVAILGAAVQLGIAALVTSWGTLVVALMAAGVVNAAGQVAANLLLARAVPVQRHGLAFGVKQSGMPAGTMLAGLAVPLAVAVGWRWAYVAGAGIALLGAALVPQIDGARSALRLRAPQEVLSSSRLALAVLAAGVGFGAAAAGALVAFLVSSAVTSGIQEWHAGLLLTGGSLLGMTVRLVAGIRADARPGSALPVVALMLALGGCGSILLAVGEPVTTMLAVPFAFGAGWAWPGLFNLAIVRANPGAAARATGITQTGTYLGVVVGPVLAGAVVRQWGYGPAWLVVGAIAWAGAAATLIGRRLLHAEPGPTTRTVEHAAASSRGTET